MPSDLEIYATVFQALGAVCLFLMLKGSGIPGFFSLTAGYVAFLASAYLKMSAFGRADWRFSASSFLYLLAALLFVFAARKLARSNPGESEGKL